MPAAETLSLLDSRVCVCATDCTAITRRMKIIKAASLNIIRLDGRSDIINPLAVLKRERIEIESYSDYPGRVTVNFDSFL